MAGSITLNLLLLGAFASQAMASCAYGTLLHPRAEDGTVEVNTFGYTGQIVSKPNVGSLIDHTDSHDRALPTGFLSIRLRTLYALLVSISLPSTWSQAPMPSFLLPN